MHDPKHCRSCNGQILWAQVLDDKGQVKLQDGRPKAMPVDFIPNPSGNVVIYDRAGGIVARVLRRGEAPGPGEQLRTPHHQTCPHAADWRATVRARKERHHG